MYGGRGHASEPSDFYPLRIVARSNSVDLMSEHCLQTPDSDSTIKSKQTLSEK